MGDGTKENPYTRKDVLKLIKENGGTAEGLDLSGKVFEEGVDLSGLNLDGIILKKAILPRPHFEGSSLMNAHFEEVLSLSAHFERARLWGAHLEGADLSSAHLEGAYLYGIKFTSDTVLESVDWGNYILDEEKLGFFDFAVASYRHLKMWYTNAGYHDIAAKFYYREKEANRKALKWCSRNWHHRGASEFIRALFGYGERWWNVVFSIEALILLFAFTYLAIATSWEWWRILLVAWIPGLIVWFVCLKIATGLDWTWWKKAPVWATGMVSLFFAFYFLSELVLSRHVFLHHLYFSTVSFTALGYGEWVKLDYSSAYDAIRRIGAFESLVGISMMALLLVTFFRKWTR